MRIRQSAFADMVKNIRFFCAQVERFYSLRRQRPIRHARDIDELGHDNRHGIVAPADNPPVGASDLLPEMCRFVGESRRQKDD